MSWSRAFSAAIVVICDYTACAAPEAQVSSSVADSAGIEIVESQAPMWGEGEGWTLSPDPSLEIGQREGEGAYLFQGVSGVVRLGNGAIVVANVGDNTLRYYDRDGMHLRTVGGRGGGPAEFSENIAGLRNLADSVVVWQFALQPSKLFDHEGNFVRSLGLPQRPMEIHGVLVGGSHVYSSRLASAQSRAPSFVDSGYVYLSRPGFNEIDSVGPLPMRSLFGAFFPLPYGPARSIAGRGDRWYYGWPEAYEYRVMSSSNELLRIVRRAWERVPVTEADREQYRQSELAQTLRRRGLNPNGEGTFPEYHAAFQRIEAGPSGTVWIERTVAGWYRDELRGPAYSDVPVTWDVFSASGAWLGPTVFPARFRVSEIGRDYVVGVWKDDLDVEYVRLYALLK